MSPRNDSGAALGTVFIVDDDEGVRRGLLSMLTASGFLVETFDSAESFLASDALNRPGCAILDVRMSGMDGLEMQRELRTRGISLPIIVLTGHANVPMAVAAMEQGAVTLLEKPAQPDELLACVRKSLEQNLECRQQAAERQEIAARMQQLTPRELQVLEQLIQGKKPKTIARVLGTKEATVRVQRFHILSKMHADGVTDLLRMMQLLRSE